jgi:hypothetical protein
LSQRISNKDLNGIIIIIIIISIAIIIYITIIIGALGGAVG